MLTTLSFPAVFPATTRDKDLAVRSAGWRAITRLVQAQDRLSQIPQPDETVAQVKLDIEAAIEEVSYAIMPNFDDMLRDAWRQLDAKPETGI